MKKAILIAAIFVVSTFSASSQGLEWGIKAGINLSPAKTSVSDPRGNTRYKTSTYAGFHAGVFVGHRGNADWGIQGELLYSTSMVGSGYGKGVDFWSYLVLPVMGKWYVSERFSLDAGPQIGVLLINDIQPSQDNERDIDLSLGAGLSYRIGRRFEVSTRYNWGLTELAKGVDEYNNTFRLGVGYRF